MTPDYDYVLTLLKKEGLYMLGGTDGCACAHFQINSIYVAVSCHKSVGCHKEECNVDGPLVHVYSHYMDWNPNDGIEISQEIVRQLRGSYYPVSDIAIRLHEPEFYKTGRKKSDKELK